MVGTLKLVGDGSWPVERVAAALAARDRAAAGPTAPADGLCLPQAIPICRRSIWRRPQPISLAGAVHTQSGSLSSDPKCGITSVMNSSSERRAMSCGKPKDAP